MPTETRPAASVPVPEDLSAVAVKQFLNGLAAVMETRPPLVVLDCGRLGQVTSSHVNLLWQAYRQCESAGLAMQLRSASQNLVRILRLLDLDGLFTFDESSQPETYDDDVVSTSEGIDEGLQRFLRYLGTVGIPESIMFELRTIVYETLTNIRIHSGIRPGEPVGFSAVYAPNRMLLTFVDSGPPFDPTARPDQFDFRKAAENGQTHGFGIVMIKRLATRIGYVRSGNHTNVLTVEKLWGN